MQVSIKIDGLDDVKRQLGAMQKQASYAASRAINTTTFAVNAEIKKSMQATFAGGATPYTQRAFSVAKADKASLTASVSLRTDAPAGGTNYSKALAHLFKSGRRDYKRIEGWLRGHGLMPSGKAIAPGSGMPLDQYGNMRRAALTEMLGVIKTQRPNLRVYRRTGAGKAQKATGYFVAMPTAGSKLEPGIYKRIETGSSSVIKSMILYVDPTSYRRLIDIEKIGREVVAKTFQPAFDAELRTALANAR